MWKVTRIKMESGQIKDGKGSEYKWKNSDLKKN